MLSQVQENCSYEESRLLDKVMDFLKKEGLYNPQMKELRTDDPVATDLIGALLMVRPGRSPFAFIRNEHFLCLQQGPSNTMSSRRGSNDSVTRSTGRKSSVLTPLKTKCTSLINSLLQNAMEWDFDIFRLEELTEKRPLLHLGMELFRRFDVCNTFNIDEMTCKSWFIVMEAHYHSSNTYHNSTHAADVMQVPAPYTHTHTHINQTHSVLHSHATPAFESIFTCLLRISISIFFRPPLCFCIVYR